MTKLTIHTSTDPCTEQRECNCKPKRPTSEQTPTDLDIQTFIRLASGGIDNGFDRLMIR